MRIVLQRVSRAAVRVEGTTVGEIGHGGLLLVGAEEGDGPAQVDQAVAKLAGLRIFEDREGRMNLAAGDVGGAFLVVSQFTLAGSTRKGRRPSFDRALAPELAEPLVEKLARGLENEGFEVGRGRFGAHMEVESVNDGPVTFVLDF